MNKKIFFLHGYNSSGKKFNTIKKFVESKNKFQILQWEWNQNINLKEFITEKIYIIKNSPTSSYIMADSMGSNIALQILNNLPKIKYILLNPVLSYHQILNKELIQEQSRERIFEFTHENILNKNGKLIISKNDEILDSSYHKKIFKFEQKNIMNIDDSHKIKKLDDYMPQIYSLIENSFY